jgi:putative Mg2+ transporter-C (MgtC) family protein
MIQPDFVEYLTKILLAIMLGGLIGIERELTYHWAGLRTHMLVSLGASMFMFLNDLESLSVGSDVGVTLDITRLATGVIMGIGFLGAGVIFKEGVSVRGLTTAASIWVTAAVGLLVGVGKFKIAIIATAIIIIVLYSDFLMEKRFIKSREIVFMYIRLNDKTDVQNRVEKKLESEKIEFSLVDFKREDQTIHFGYKIIISKLQQEPITRVMLKDPDVVKISWKD